jgi:soluble P-type ATPase
LDALEARLAAAEAEAAAATAAVKALRRDQAQLLAAVGEGEATVQALRDAESGRMVAMQAKVSRSTRPLGSCW